MLDISTATKEDPASPTNRRLRTLESDVTRAALTLRLWAEGSMSEHAWSLNNLAKQLEESAGLLGEAGGESKVGART